MIVTLQYNGVTAQAEVRDPTEHIQKSWVAGNFYEAHSNGMLPFMASRYGPGLTYVDIGASIGNHTLFFLSVLKAQLVVAIEPWQPSFEHMCANIDLNDWYNKAICYLGAVSNFTGTSCVERYDNGGNNLGMIRISDAGQYASTTPLDDALKRYSVDVIKMDVEHHNRQVLEGATETLNQGAEWFIECESEAELAETEAIMAAHGYDRVPGVRLNWTSTYLFVPR